MIGIFSNGLRTSRSGSPVMMQSAFPERASSRYMSSSGSRQIVTVWNTGIILTNVCISKINSSLDSRVKYLSNFGRRNLLLNSLKVFCEARMISVFFDLSQQIPRMLPLKMEALKRTLESKITTTYRLSSPSFSSRSFFSISGVSPFRSAWSLKSSIISSRLRRFVINWLRVSDMAFFCVGDIFSIFSAAGSLTSRIIVFMTLLFSITIYFQ